MSQDKNQKPEKTAQELELEHNVDADVITLVNEKDEEYNFIVLEELEHNGNRYLALSPCDEKTDMGFGDDPGESNDITVVREGIVNGEVNYFAVNDADELYAIAKIIDERYGHLNAQEEADEGNAEA